MYLRTSSTPASVGWVIQHVYSYTFARATSQQSSNVRLCQLDAAFPATHQSSSHPACCRSSPLWGHQTPDACQQPTSRPICHLPKNMCFPPDWQSAECSTAQRVTPSIQKLSPLSVCSSASSAFWHRMCCCWVTWHCCVMQTAAALAGPLRHSCCSNWAASHHTDHAPACRRCRQLSSACLRAYQHKGGQMPCRGE
jgi:hypothetical protein